MRVGVLAVYRPQFNQAVAQREATQVQDAIGQLPGLEAVWLSMLNEWEAAEALPRLDSAWGELDALVVVMGSFVGADVAVQIARRIKCPLILWALPEPSVGGGRLELNSLCGGIMTNHAFKQMGAEIPMIYGNPRDQDVTRSLLSILRVENTRAKLRNAEIGVVGQHPPGYYPCEYDELELYSRLGVRVTKIPLSEAFAAGDEASDADLAAARNAAGHLVGLDTINPDQVTRSVKAEYGLRRLISERNLTSITVECWPQYMTEYGGAVCWAMNRLIDDQVMAGCEADVYGTVTMILCRELGGESPFFGDLVHTVSDDRLVFWHCGAAPLSLAGEAPRASVHPNRKVGLTLDFALKGGPATVLRLHHDARGFALMAIEGEAVADPLYFSGNTAAVRTVRPPAKVLAGLLNDGAEHHFALGYGVALADVERLGKRLDIPVYVY